MTNDSSSKLGVPDSTGRKSYTPKAFHTVAQGRRAAAHPGLQVSETPTLKGLYNHRTIKINRLENVMFQLVEPFQGSFISTNDYPQGGEASPLSLVYAVQPLRGIRLMASRLVGPDLELPNDQFLRRDSVFFHGSFGPWTLVIQSGSF